MSIELHCTGCGKLIRAPREAAGRRARCPACGREMYIPTPPEEREELPLAPEDTTLLEREAALQAERRRLESVLRRERDPEGHREPASREPSHRSSSPRESRTTANLPQTVIEYLRALARSDLSAADQFLPTLRSQKADVLALLDRLAADEMPPAALGNVPPGVYQGFLKHLRGQL